MTSRKPTWSMHQSSDDDELTSNSKSKSSNSRSLRSSRRDRTRPAQQDEEEEEEDNSIRHQIYFNVENDDNPPEQDRDQEMTLEEETSNPNTGTSTLKDRKRKSSIAATPNQSFSNTSSQINRETTSGPSTMTSKRRSSSTFSDLSDSVQAETSKRRKEDAGNGNGNEEIKRTRISNACADCKQKKVKCDGNSPCARCTKLKRECIYSHNKDKSAYSRRYVESLEQRLERLEQSLKHGFPNGFASQSGSNPPTTSRTSDQNAPDTFKSASNQEKGSRAPVMVSFAQEAADLPALSIKTRAVPTPTSVATTPATPATPSVSTLEGPGSLVSNFPGNTAGRLQMDENRSLRYLGPSASVTLFLDAHNSLGSQSASRALELAMLPPDTNSTEDLQWLTSSLGMSLSNVLPSAETVTFPPYDLAKMLVRIYFDQIHSVFSVLDQLFACASRACKDPRVCPAGKEAEKFGYSSTSESLPNGESTSPNYSLAGITFFARAQVLSLHRATHTRLEQVQCTALLAYYMAACNCAARAWILIGQGLRNAIDLGLHRDLAHLNLSFFEISMRRHVFWNIYILDRLLSISLGRPLGIEDDNIDAQLPTLEPQPPFPLIAGFSSLVSLHRLAGCISRTANRLEQARHRGDATEANRLRLAAHKHELELNEWFSDLPEHLKSGQHEVGSPLATQSTIAFSCYQSATMVLFRSLLQDDIFTSGASEHDSDFIESRVFLAKCTRTSLMVIKAAPRIASSMPASHYLLEYGQSLLVSGGFLALNAWKHSSSNAFQLLSEADEAVVGLRALEVNLPGAKNLRRALVRLLKSLRNKLGMRQRSGVNTPSSTTLNRAGPSTSQSSDLLGKDQSQRSNLSSNQSHSSTFKDISPSEVTAMLEANGGSSSLSPEVSRSSMLNETQFNNGQNPYFGGFQSHSPNFNSSAEEGLNPLENADHSILADVSLDALAFTDSNLENWSGLDWLNGLLNDNPAPAASTPSQQQGSFNPLIPEPAVDNAAFDFSAALWDDQVPISLEEAGKGGSDDGLAKSKGKGKETSEEGEKEERRKGTKEKEEKKQLDS